MPTYLGQLADPVELGRIADRLNIFHLIQSLAVCGNTTVSHGLWRREGPLHHSPDFAPVS
jgi:hypothetical protein